MVDLYNCRPSTLFGLQDAYESFCFDEACSYIIRKIQNGEEPIFEKKYKSFSDLYKQYE